MNIKNIKNDLLIALVIFFGVFVLMYIMYGFSGEGITSPISYDDGDDLSVLTTAKSIGENGWLGHNERCGAPYGLDMNDYTASYLMNIENLLTKIIYLFAKDPVITLNIQFLINMSLSAFTAFCVFRALKIRRLIAGYGALIYGCAPYIQTRGVDHLCLSAAYFVPLSILLCIWCYENKDDYLKFNKGFYNYRNILSLIFICLIANNGIGYYPVFTCFFLCVTALFSIINDKAIKNILCEIKLIVGIIIIFLINLTPVFFYQLKNGNNLNMFQRNIEEGEIYGLKIAYFFINPINTHGIKFLEDLKNSYYGSMPLVNENATGYLGLIGIIGFLIALVSLLLIKRNQEVKEQNRIKFLSSLVVFAILFATIGGFSGLISVYFHSIRSYNRISIYITFICITIAVLSCDKLLAVLSLKSSRRKKIAAAMMVLIGGLGIWDQLPSIETNAAKLKNNAAAFNSEKSFIQLIEAQLQEGDMIYQLPYLEYPEGVPINNLSSYGLFVGYIHSDSLKWSFGSNKGREGDIWNELVSDLPMQDLIDTICAAGFRGLYIDARAYQDESLINLKDEIESVIKTTSISSENGNLIFYNLYPYIQENPQVLNVPSVSFGNIDIPETALQSVFSPSENIFSFSTGLEEHNKGDFVWTSKNFQVMISNPEIKKSGLLISMRTELSKYLEQNPKLDPKIEIYINGQFVRNVDVIDGMTDLRIIPANEHTNDIYQIEIKTNCSFNPQHIGENNDTRNLSIALYYIGDNARSNSLIK